MLRMNQSNVRHSGPLITSLTETPFILYLKITSALKTFRKCPLCLPKICLNVIRQSVMRQWAQEHGKAVRQQTVRQYTTKHSAGTLPLNMYQNELPTGERVVLEYSDQQSEYDSGSGEEEGDSSEDQEEVTPPDLNSNAINFLSRSIRTRSGRAISLSHRALASYQ